MFGDDGRDLGENDDRLPLSQRGWFRRMMERAEAARRFDAEHPDAIQRIACAEAERMAEVAMDIFLGRH